MGTLTYKTGDLLDDSNPEEVVAHQVNCRGGFGSGVAGAIAKKYPAVRAAYLRKHNSSGWKLGQVQYVGLPGESGRIYANIAGQDSYGPTGTHVVYEALEIGLMQVISFCEGAGYSLALPRLGAGMAGGEWPVIEGILLRILAERDVSVTVYVL